MSRLRADLWCAAFVRRHNDLGHICVISRKGDPVAGQIWLEVDHRDGTYSLFSPAPSLLVNDQADWVFQPRFERVEYQKVRERIELEADYDPDFWVLALEMRGNEFGFERLKT